MPLLEDTNKLSLFPLPCVHVPKGGHLHCRKLALTRNPTLSGLQLEFQLSIWVRENNNCCLCYPVYDTLLWYAYKWAKTPGEESLPVFHSISHFQCHNTHRPILLVPLLSSLIFGQNKFPFTLVSLFIKRKS